MDDKKSKSHNASNNDIDKTQLNDYVETIRIININKNESRLSESKLISNCNINDFIVSDVDEKMVILIKFNHIVSLKCMTIYANINNNLNIMLQFLTKYQFINYKI